MKIAVIGSRDIKDWLKSQVHLVGKAIVSGGHSLVTGGAPGTDQTVALGGCSVNPRKVTVYLPWQSFEYGAHDPEANKIVPEYYFGHPHTQYLLETYFNKQLSDLSQGVTKLMARNIAIIENADRVIAFPRINKQGIPQGGTAMGIWYANQINVPVAVHPNDQEYAKWDICPTCLVYRTFYDCGHSYHGLKPYCEAALG